ncbi:EamA family transporter [Olivibacter sp. SDN3]|uniref:EamA family transporter n=1 Tax=Olivibacter sp. SDN3 TaxID=2764720 RepID=UPI001650E992|nr:DMT family transporter [Olivibacter sp. SDN3]QNL48589.1 EamA family transporter [Olivibacter sp. SDN3]
MRIHYAALVFIGACSFGILSTFVKKAYADGFTLGQVTGVQMFFGLAFLWGLYYTPFRQWLRNHNDSESDHKDRPWKVMLSGVSTGLVSIFYYKCVQLIPASIAIILLMQYVWIGLVIELLLFKRIPTLLQILCVLLVFLGTILAAGLFSERPTSISISGVLYGILAASSYATFLIVSDRIGKDYHPLRKSALMLTGSTLLVFIIFPPTFLINGLLWKDLWFWGLILSIFGTVIPPLFFAIGIPKIGLPFAAILSTAELPVAVLMSHFLLNEKVMQLQWLGILIILIAILTPNILQIGKAKKHPYTLQK